MLTPSVSKCSKNDKEKNSRTKSQAAPIDVNYQQWPSARRGDIVKIDGQLYVAKMAVDLAEDIEVCTTLACFIISFKRISDERENISN